MAALFCVSSLSAISVTPDVAHKIALKIWKNECGGTKEGLTSWNKGENFGSFGIGHFIWYPSGKQERFKESFPDLLKFLQSQNVELPKWLSNAQGCPWASRDDFNDHLQDPKMIELRQLLYDTRDLQAIFIAKKLEKVLPEMTKNLSANDKEKVTATFQTLAKDPKGLYALIDYLNFKGTGITSSESYNGQQWGLLQVLQHTTASSDSKDVLASFVASAKTILTRRVENSPPERNENRWLKGWLNRINTYLKDEG